MKCWDHLTIWQAAGPRKSLYTVGSRCGGGTPQALWNPDDPIMSPDSGHGATGFDIYSARFQSCFDLIFPCCFIPPYITRQTKSDVYICKYKLFKWKIQYLMTFGGYIKFKCQPMCFIASYLYSSHFLQIAFFFFYSFYTYWQIWVVAINTERHTYSLSSLLRKKISSLLDFVSQQKQGIIISFPGEADKLAEEKSGREKMINNLCCCCLKPYIK